MLPTDATERKNTPVYTGFMCFFPLGIAEVAKHSHDSTQQHHPGEPCHWDKNKSTDEKDSQARHLLDQTFPDQTLDELILHARAGAWRAMANLERLCAERQVRDAWQREYNARVANGEDEIRGHTYETWMRVHKTPRFENSNLQNLVEPEKITGRWISPGIEAKAAYIESLNR